MSGTRSPLKTAPAIEAGGIEARSIESGRIDPKRARRLWLILWPFATTATAINLFLLGLMGTWLGLPALSPVAALWLSLPLGLPATFAARRWIGGLIAEAEA